VEASCPFLFGSSSNCIACAQVFLATHQEHVNHHLVVDEVDRKDSSTDAGMRYCAMHLTNDSAAFPARALGW